MVASLSLVNLTVVLGLFYFFWGGGGGINELTLILIWFWFIVLNATFSNISAISWRPVLVVEEAGVSECTLFCNLQSQARTHAVLVIGFYVIQLPSSLSHPGPDSDTENYRSLWCQTHDVADKKNKWARVLKVSTDIFTSIKARPIRLAVIM